MSSPRKKSLKYGARCPGCGWKLPLIYKPARPGRKRFDCPGCGEVLHLSKLSEPGLNSSTYMVLLVAFLYWFNSFEGGVKLMIFIAVFALAVLHVGLEKLQFVEDVNEIDHPNESNK